MVVILSILCVLLISFCLFYYYKSILSKRITEWKILFLAREIKEYMSTNEDVSDRDIARKIYIVLTDLDIPNVDYVGSDIPKFLRKKRH